MRRVLRWTALALALGGAGSCSSGTGPVAGLLTVSLATPNAGADGAMLLTVTGPSALTSVTAGTGLVVFSQALSATNCRLLPHRREVGSTQSPARATNAGVPSGR